MRTNSNNSGRHPTGKPNGRWEEFFQKTDPRLREAMEEFERAKTLGDRLSDKVADVGGSWTFIALFMVVMVVWVISNVFLLRRPFDPYPFILLNLALSTLAAVQAPIILMSQNRQADRDRLRAEYEYLMNLETNRQIQSLREELDEIKHGIRELLRKDDD
jgi:uncharacterized membrane protein